MATKQFISDDYKEDDSSNYYKFQDGENRFRALDSAVFGTEGWSNNKPIRWHLEDETPAVEWDKNKDGTDKRPKRFWAFPVWNYDLEKVQILELTQVTIRRVINSLMKNPKWGSPLDYDLVVMRSGEGFDIKYTVTPDPKEALDPGVAKIYASMKVDLEKLFTGEDPFGGSKVAADTSIEDSGAENVNPDDIPF